MWITTGKKGFNEQSKWRKIEKNANFCVNLYPPYIENHLAKVVNKLTGKLSNKDVNVDKCFEIGSEQVENLHQTFPKLFCNPFSKQVKAMSILQKNVWVNDE